MVTEAGQQEHVTHMVEMGQVYTRKAESARQAESALQALHSAAPPKVGTRSQRNNSTAASPSKSANSSASKQLRHGSPHSQVVGVIYGGPKKGIQVLVQRVDENHASYPSDPLQSHRIGYFLNAMEGFVDVVATEAWKKQRLAKVTEWSQSNWQALAAVQVRIIHNRDLAQAEKSRKKTAARAKKIEAVAEAKKRKAEEHKEEHKEEPADRERKAKAGRSRNPCSVALQVTLYLP